MKKWILVTLLVFAAGSIIFLFMIYSSASSPMNERQQAAQEQAEEQFDLSEIEYTNFFHGTVSYQVFDAINEDGEEIYIWMPEEIDEDDAVIQSNPEVEEEDAADPQPIVRLHSEGITEQEALAAAQSGADVAEVRSIRLGIIQTSPVYEVNYRDSSGRYGFYYLSFEDGEYLRRYELAS